MAVPSPRTWVAAEFETATIFNGDQRDTDNFLLAPPRCCAYRSAAFSLTSSSTWFVIPFDAEVYDPYSTPMHDLSTNTSRIIAPETGLYQANLKVSFAANATGNRFYELRKNAAGVQTGGTQITTAVTANIGASNSTVMGETVEVQLNATDYVELFANQTSGGSLALTIGQALVFVQLRFVSKQ